jgi:ATP-dependent helicase/DNAse subunit B
VGNTILFDIERYKTQPFANVKSEVFFKTQIEGLNFVAYIDRIDVSSDNIVNIIDYKTTNNKTTKKVNIVELFNSPFSAYHEIFQVLLYCYIYKQQNPNAIVRPILYKIQSLKSQKDIQPITLFVPNQLRSSTLPSLDTDLSSLMDIKDCEEISVTSYNKIEVAFEWLLQKTLRNIINTNTLFTINPLDKKGNACTYCQFKNLCNHTPQK